MKKHRNTNFVVQESYQNLEQAKLMNLMQVTINGRNNKQVVMPDGQLVTEFINCSYLGLDLHPDIIKASRSIDDSWGVNFCCARSRFSIEPLRLLEENLSHFFGGSVITFPSVTTTHISVLPLVASGVLINHINPPKVRMVFDKLAHSSMQYLKPILAEEAVVTTIKHNDLESLQNEIIDAKNQNETVVYVADGVYSMGGLCPIDELLKMSQEHNFYIYLDDAHATSIFGKNGRGSILSKFDKCPPNLFVSFALSKGFGCNGGGIVLPSDTQASIAKSYGQIYAFSAALDFSVINACLAALKLHFDGTVDQLQDVLRSRVAYFDKLMKLDLPFSPIRMAMVGEESKAIEVGKKLLAKGFFVSTVFFPVVARNKAQLRICIAANHTNEQIEGLVAAIKELGLP